MFSPPVLFRPPRVSTLVTSCYAPISKMARSLNMPSLGIASSFKLGSSNAPTVSVVPAMSPDYDSCSVSSPFLCPHCHKNRTPYRPTAPDGQRPDLASAPPRCSSMHRSTSTERSILRLTPFPSTGPSQIETPVATPRNPPRDWTRAGGGHQCRREQSRRGDLISLISPHELSDQTSPCCALRPRPRCSSRGCRLA